MIFYMIGIIVMFLVVSSTDVTTELSRFVQLLLCLLMAIFWPITLFVILLNVVCYIYEYVVGRR